MVRSQLKKQSLKPNSAISDDVFLRRVYLDIAGRVPTIEEAENFLGSDYDRKRAQLITDLLESDGHTSHSYNFWADILRINQGLGNNASAAGAAYELWLKEAISSNIPYDQFVRELVAATGNIWENGAVGYYQRDRGMPLDNMSNTVRVFLGTRLECAQCHNHPFDKWTQMDYYQMAAFSYGMNANYNSSANRQAYNDHMREKRKVVHGEFLAKNKLPENFPAIDNQRSLDRLTGSSSFEKHLKRVDMTERQFRKAAGKSMAVMASFKEENYAESQALSQIYQQLRYYSSTEQSRTLKLPHDYQYSDADPHDPVSAATMFGTEIDLANIDDSAITAYADWMTTKDNPTFTKVIANRLWKRVFGHGVFEPADELTDHTFVSNPDLLTYLETLMRDLDYDMRAYMEILYNTKTYQAAAFKNEMIMGAPFYFQGPVLRRMTAEQIWDSIVTLALPEADSYRPLLKSQLSRVEKMRQLYQSVEGQSSDEYIAMMEELGEGLNSLMPKRESLLKRMYAARDEGREEAYNRIRKEFNEVNSQMRKLVRDIGYRNTGTEVDAESLLAATGMAEMMMTSDQMMGTDGMADPGEQMVLTQLPKMPIKRPDPEMSKQEKQRFSSVQKAEHRNYTTLVAKMARASELQSPAARGHFLREFGQSDREVIENAATSASVPQALNLLNGPMVEALVNEYAVFGNRLHTATDSEEKIRMIFQAMLTRQPTSDEMELASAEVEQFGDKAYEGIVWALLNTQQFMFVQ
ncbi:MAG: DUF1549 domain-containing protein [Verrucomicrobiota bacterium]